MDGSTADRSRRRFVIVYAAVMTALGVTAFVITWLLTDSVWWALLALFLAGPVARVFYHPVGR